MSDAAEEEDEPDDGLITCWCGAVGTYEELFSQSGLDARCGGSGHVNCDCGGDFCVCHWHGGTECVGCPDCESDDDEGFDDGFDDEADE